MAFNIVFLLMITLVGISKQHELISDFNRRYWLSIEKDLIMVNCELAFNYTQLHDKCRFKLLLDKHKYVSQHWNDIVF